MSWPPNPDKQPDNSQQNNQQHSQQPNYAQPNQLSNEWKIIEKTMLASVEEQRRARRWGIFFKFLTFGYLILFFVLMGGRGCSSAPDGSAMPMVKEPHIAVIDVNGVISNDKDANANDINKAVNKAYDNEHVKAVALRINSPGGSPVQSDEIWLNIMEQRKEHPDIKTYALIGDVGASGAYYIASAADEIYVNPSSLVGSIGVIMPSYDVQELMKKMGVKDRTMHAGEYKDILSMGREMTEFEKEHIDKLLASTHQNFIDAVKEGRGDKLKDPEKNKLFTGLFWTGKQSLELGLADKKGGLTQLKKDLELEKAIDYTPVDPMQKLLEQFAVKMGSGFGTAMKNELLQEQQGTELR